MPKKFFRVMTLASLLLAALLPLQPLAALTYSEILPGQVKGTATSVNISSYGACSAADAASAISQAFAAVADNGTVNFDCQANLGSTVTLSGRSGVTVQGVNGGGFKVTGIGTASNGISGGILFDVRNCTNCTVKDLIVDGNNNYCAAAFGATNNTNTTFSNLNIRNMNMQCGPDSQATAVFEASGNTGNIYRGITIDRDTTNLPAPAVRVMRGMWLGNWWQSAIETNPTVEGNFVYKTGHSGIVVQGTGTVKVQNNTANDTGCAGLKVLMDGYFNPNSTGLISGNTANRNDCHGVQITLNYGARNLTVSNNTFEENTQSGIYVVNEDSGSSEILRNSSFTSNIIRNNKSSNLTGGLYFNNGGQNITVSGNTFASTNAAQPQLAGIVFGGNANLNGFNISTNNFSGHSRDGITFWNTPGQTSGVTVSDNTFSSNAAYGVFGAGGTAFSGVSGTGNVFSGNGNQTSGNITLNSSSSSAPAGGTTPTPPASGGSTPPAPSSPSPVTSSEGFVTAINSFDVLRSDYAGWVGFSFTVSSQALTLTSLGRYVVSGNSQAHAVKIVRASDSANLGSATVSTAGKTINQFAYADLSSPITLSANTTYYIVSQETVGGDQWYNNGNTILSFRGDATINNGVYFNGSGFTTTGIARTSYVPVDFKYYVGTPPAAAPSTPSTPPAAVATTTPVVNPPPVVVTPPAAPAPVVTAPTPSGAISTPPSGSQIFVTGKTLGTLRSDYTGWVGTKFTVGSSNLTVKALARFVESGSQDTHLLKLVDASTGQDVSGSQVSLNLSAFASGQFAYAQLSAPVVLSANKIYYLVSQERAAGDTWRDLDSRVVTTGDAFVNSGVYFTSQSTWYPTGIANATYGPLDFAYSVGGTLPAAPATPPAVTTPPAATSTPPAGGLTPSLPPNNSPSQTASGTPPSTSPPSSSGGSELPSTPPASPGSTSGQPLPPSSLGGSGSTGGSGGGSSGPSSGSSGGGGGSFGVMPASPSVLPRQSSGDSIKLINNSGTFYVIQNGQRQGVTNPGMLKSYGLEFKDAKPASSVDLSVPEGTLLKPGSGSLVKSPTNPTVYLIAEGQKHGFVSSQVFSLLGFKFSSVLVVTAPELDSMPLGDILSQGTVRHKPGLNISDNGTIYYLTATHRHPYPSLEVYNSWNPDNDFSAVVPANSQDLQVPVGENVTKRIVE